MLLQEQHAVIAVRRGMVIARLRLTSPLQHEQHRRVANAYVPERLVFRQRLFVPGDEQFHTPRRDAPGLRHQSDGTSLPTRRTTVARPLVRTGAYTHTRHLLDCELDLAHQGALVGVHSESDTVRAGYEQRQRLRRLLFSERAVCISLALFGRRDARFLASQLRCRDRGRQLWSEDGALVIKRPVLRPGLLGGGAGPALGALR
jgi:hypothetical protein